jgi:endonuclease/exonuclease/phosphatase (EEP) superfamily protein YafD
MKGEVKHMPDVPRQGQESMPLVRKGGAILLSGLATGPAVAGMLALSGRFIAPLDVFSHFAPMYVVAGLVLGLMAFVTKQRAALAMSFAAVVAGLTLLAPEFTRSTGRDLPEGSSGQIKVIQLNAQRTNRDLDRTVDWLVAQDADVVAISETRHDLRDRLMARRLGLAGEQGSLMIFTRAPYLRMDRPKVAKASELTFVNATYALPGGEAEIVTMHFDWPTRSTFRYQPWGLETVVKQRPTRRMLLLGDFNNTPWSQHMQALDTRLGLIRRDRAVATWPAEVLGQRWPLPFLPIDHIYAGPGWATVKVERGPWLGSDHYPLIVTLAPIP